MSEEVGDWSISNMDFG